MIVILLSTYNGEKYIKQQLDSLHSQTYKKFKIIVRDDKSTDNTLEILKSFDIKLVDSNQNLGAKKSFASLLEYAVQNSNAKYFIFCDQDDIWEKDKIEKTLKKMEEMENEFCNMPLLVHTDLKVVDEKLNTLSPSMWKYQNINPSSNSLNKLLIQNTITGCTMIINRKLARKCLNIASKAIMHDWWIGLVASTFGKIGYLDYSSIMYRQHGKNDTGTQKYSFKYILKKIQEINEINLNKNIFQAKAFLDIFEDELDNKTKEMLLDFTNIKEKTYVKRVFILFKYDLFKQGIIRNIGMIIKI